MRYGYILYCFIILFSSPRINIHAQSLNALKKEIIYRTRQQPGDTSWKNSSRTIFSYNDKGKITYQANYLWSVHTNDWKINVSREYEYDGSGNLVFRNYIVYDEETLRPRQENTEKHFFEGGKIRKRFYEFRDFESNDRQTWEYDYEYENLENGNKVNTTRIEWNDYLGQIQSITINKFYSDQEECIYGEYYYQFVHYKQSGKQRNSWDSVSIEFYERPGCYSFQKRDWEKSIANARFELVTLTQYDREFDSSGREIRNLTKIKDPYYSQFWENQDEWLKQYNEVGEITENTYHSFLTDFSYRQQFFYDNEGNISYKNFQLYDTLTMNWVYASEEFNHFNEFNQLEYRLSRTEHDEPDGSFDDIIESFYSYSEDQYLKKIRFIGKEKDYSSGETVEYITETTYENRCDGEVLRSRSELIEGSFPGGVFNANEITFQYYDIPSCQPDETKIENVRVGPNPARQYINVIADSNFGNMEIQLLDLAGRIKYNEVFNSGNYLTINLTGIRSGLYLLKIISDQGNYTEKIIIE